MRKHKIIGDSSCDVTQSMQEQMNITLVPLTMEVDHVRYVDDDTLDVADYLKKANKSAHIPKTSCPSPQEYMQSFEGEEEEVFVVPLSSELSGSYNSAVLAKQMYEEEHPDSTKKIHVFNSKSASSGEVVLAFKLWECFEKGMAFDEIVSTVETFIEDMYTIFVLEKIDHLQKAGRMSKVTATLANILNIKLVLASTPQGEIELVSKARGMNKAIDKMVQSLGELGTVTKEKIIVVGHCQALDRANQVRDKIKALYDFKDIVVVSMRGLSSNYANLGGIVLAY